MGAPSATVYRFLGVGLMLVCLGEPAEDDGDLGLNARTGVSCRCGNPGVLGPEDDWKYELPADGRPAMDKGRWRVVLLREDGGEFVGESISCLIGIEPGGDV